MTSIFTSMKQLKVTEPQPITAYPFQEEGVQFIDKHNGRALIADEMGLGKTIQALLWIKRHPDQGPFMIVCPVSAKMVWYNESIKVLGIEPLILTSKTVIRKDKMPDMKITIINYDILDGHGGHFYTMEPKTVILDEGHYIKNLEAKRTKALLRIVKDLNPRNRIVLTGTPIENKPAEIYPSLSLLRPDLFNNMSAFMYKFCEPRKDPKGRLVFDGSSNTKQLHKILTTHVMIRRRKRDVLPQLPKKTRSVIPMHLANARTYRRAEEDFINWIAEEYNNCPKKMRAVKRAQALVKMGELKRLVAEGKMKSVVQWIDDYLESGNKLVVFTVHQRAMDFLLEYYKEKAVFVRGGMSDKKRQDSVVQFQNNPKIKLFIGQIKAAGVALTLTAAHATCFVEIRWTPGEHEQAEDRVLRIGQTADKVFAYYLLCPETIEERTSSIIEKKRKIISQIMDGKNPEDRDIYKMLLESYGAKTEEEEDV